MIFLFLYFCILFWYSSAQLMSKPFVMNISIKEMGECATCLFIFAQVVFLVVTSWRNYISFSGNRKVHCIHVRFWLRLGWIYKLNQSINVILQVEIVISLYFKSFLELNCISALKLVHYLLWSNVRFWLKPGWKCKLK